MSIALYLLYFLKFKVALKKAGGLSLLSFCCSVSSLLAFDGHFLVCFLGQQDGLYVGQDSSLSDSHTGE